MAIPGNAGSVPPITFQPRELNAVLPASPSCGQCKCTSYRKDGNVTGRCGSFASIGLPVFVSRPEMTQLLLPQYSDESASGFSAVAKPPPDDGDVHAGAAPVCAPAGRADAVGLGASSRSGTRMAAFTAL